MTFKDGIINDTVENLINGRDYRENIIQAINAEFLDFSMAFFKKIVEAKKNDTSIDYSWYKTHFLSEKSNTIDEIIINSGLNRKTISNMYGTANKETALRVSIDNFDYIIEALQELENNADNDIDIVMEVSHGDDTVGLNLTESMLVINALATKKIQLRGGAWSSIGKRVEKPIVDRLCAMSGVPKANIDNSTFKKDKTKGVDREVDYKLLGRDGQVYRIEVKLMGKGNPESADATIARDSNIFIADTLSEQNKNQLKELGIQYVELKGNADSLADFKKVLDELDIPHSDKAALLEYSIELIKSDALKAMDKLSQEEFVEAVLSVIDNANDPQVQAYVNGWVGKAYEEFRAIEDPFAPTFEDNDVISYLRHETRSAFNYLFAKDEKKKNVEDMEKCRHSLNQLCANLSRERNTQNKS